MMGRARGKFSKNALKGTRISFDRRDSNIFLPFPLPVSMIFSLPPCPWRIIYFKRGIRVKTNGKISKRRFDRSKKLYPY